MKKLIIGSFSLLFASVMTAPAVKAQTETMTDTGTTRNQPATQIERLRQQTNNRHQQTDTDTQLKQPEPQTDWQQAPTQTEQLQQQTDQPGMQPGMQPGTGTQPGTQPGTGMEGGRQAPTQTEQLQQQTDRPGMQPGMQPGTGMEGGQQVPMQPGTGMEGGQQVPMQRGTQQAGDYETDAFNLVNSAYRGELEAQGIPGYEQLITQYNTGQVTAEDLVEAAIETNRISPEMREDDEYLNAVRLQLDAIRPTR